MHLEQQKILQAFDDSEARFFLLNWHRRARKTTLLLNLLIREAVKNENSVYGFIAPTYKQGKSIIWLDPNMLMSYLPMDRVKRIVANELYVEFDNGSLFRTFGADEPDAIRGNDFKGVVFDEWAMQKLAVWQEIIRPIIAQDSKRWAMFAFTPKGRNHAYDYWNKAEGSKDWYKSFLTAPMSNIITEEELIKAKQDMPEATFNQEFLCDFLENYAGVFKFAFIDQCVGGEFEPYIKGEEYTIGVDLAKHLDFTVICVIKNSTKQVVFFDRMNETSWTLQKARIVETARGYGNALIVPDSTGVGDPIVEDLERANCNVWYKKGDRSGFVFTSVSKEQLIENLIIFIEQNKVKYPQIDVLIDELRNFEISYTGQGKVKYSAPEGKHDDCCIALALALFPFQGDYNGEIAWVC